MIDDTSTVTPSPKQDEPKKTAPQEKTKDPKDQDPKWPGGGRKGEDEKPDARA